MQVVKTIFCQINFTAIRVDSVIVPEISPCPPDTLIEIFHLKSQDYGKLY
jgi:hypothetical protein